MTIGLDSALLAANAALAACQCALQLIDWHTTSEILKRGGRERNPLVAGLIRADDAVAHAVKFRRLAALKCAMIALAWAIAGGAWVWTRVGLGGEMPVLTAVLLIALSAWYWPIMRSNVQILRELRARP